MNRICIEGREDDRTGYGRMSMQLRYAFERRGYAVDTDPRTTDAEVVLFCTTPDAVKGWREGCRPVLFTMYETTEVPIQFRVLDQYERILVPCAANAETFGEWTDSIDIVPLGVDDRWQFRERTTDGPFIFLTAGHTYRKGWDATIAAFMTAFPDDDSVRLVIKSPHRNMELRGAASMDKRITVVEGYQSAEDEIALYGSAHCYVGLSRGEGFGLMPLQALRSGLPTIISEGHGHAEYATLADDVVRTTLVPAAGYGMHGDCGQWWEPDVDDAVRAMRRIRENYGDALNTIRFRSEFVADVFTWDETAALVERAIGGDFGFGMLGDWVTPRRPVVRFTVRRRMKADIGPHRLDLAPGVVHEYEPNVFSVLEAGGHAELVEVIV